MVSPEESERPDQPSVSSHEIGCEETAGQRPRGGGGPPRPDVKAGKSLDAGKEHRELPHGRRSERLRKDAAQQQDRWIRPETNQNRPREGARGKGGRGQEHPDPPPPTARPAQTRPALPKPAPHTHHS